jgi:hypothetical protein
MQATRTGSLCWPLFVMRHNRHTHILLYILLALLYVSGAFSGVTICKLVLCCVYDGS